MAGAAAPANPQAPDGGWGWVIVFSSFMLQALTIGITYTFGIMYVDLLEYFQASRSDTAWIGSIQPALLYFTGIVGGPLLKRFGWRVISITGAIISAIGFGTSALAPTIYLLYFTYGVLTGFGMGLMYLTSMVAVQHYFTRRRAMATGLAVAGSGVGTLAFGALIPYLLSVLKWRWTLVVDSGVVLVIGIICGSLYRPLPNSNGGHEESVSLIDDTGNNNKNYESIDVKIREKDATSRPGCCSRFWAVIKEMFDFSLFLTPSYSIFCFAILMFTFGYHVPYTYTPDRASEQFGVEPTKAALLVSVMGIANVASRLIFGWIGDKNETVRHFMTAIVLTLGGVVSVLIFLFNNLNTLVVYSCLFGAFSGCFASLFPVVLVDFMGFNLVERAIGLALAFGSIGFLFASPMSGWIIDQTKSFDAPFYVVGSAQAFGGLCFFIYVCYRHCCRRTDYQAVEIEDTERPGKRKRYISETFS